VPGNRSLDEFADDGPAEDDVEPPADADAEAAVEPLAETYAWSPDGGSCTRCGEPADARWRDGDDLVCADCKAW
jgi:hypothetical protein